MSPSRSFLYAFGLSYSGKVDKCNRFTGFSFLDSPPNIEVPFLKYNFTQISVLYPSRLFWAEIYFIMLFRETCCRKITVSITNESKKDGKTAILSANHLTDPTSYLLVFKMNYSYQ